jgi:hypothetical protein
VFRCANCGYSFSNRGSADSLWCTNDELLFCRWCAGPYIQCPRCGRQLSYQALKLVLFATIFLAMASAFFFAFTASAIQGQLYGGNSVLNPRIWVPLIAVALAASVVARGLSMGKAEERLHGEHFRTNPSAVVHLPGPLLTAEPIFWTANPRVAVARRNRWYGALLILPSVLSVVGLELLSLPSHSWGDLLLTLAAIFSGIFAASILLSTFALLRRGPRRWGISTSGLHVEYPPTAPARPLRYIGWSDVSKFDSSAVGGQNYTRIVTRLGWETYWGMPSDVVSEISRRVATAGRGASR